VKNVLFLIDFGGVFSKDDYKWNTYTFTWYQNIQPIVMNSEIKLLKEKDIWLAKLKEKRVQLAHDLTECLIRVKEFKQKDRISDADAICSELDAIKNEVNEYIIQV
jgi:hypothetical protein